MVKRIVSVLLSLAFLTGISVNAQAKAEQYVTPITGCTMMRCTGYTDSGLCADGVHYTRRGICAMAKEYIGETAFIYEVNDDGSVGMLIGIYEICDTGYGMFDVETGLGTIQAGKTIDLWMPTTEEIREFAREHGDYVYVQIVYGCVG